MREHPAARAYGRVLRRLGILCASARLVVSASVLSAQNPPPAPPPIPLPLPGLPRPAADTGRSARPDSALPDSLSPDSLRPTLPLLGPPAGPLPGGSRIVFDQDSLHFSGALTLGELLARVPGAFLVRSGWFGQPEALHYAGQGAASLELYWDGFQIDPLGEDSTGLDLSRISLGLLRRVEVEVNPTLLRVYLFSDIQPVRRARTETSFATGDASTSTYLIRYLNRWSDGTGLSLGVNYFATSGTATGKASDLTLWAKGTWTPSPQVGVEYQVMRYQLDRDTLHPPDGSGAPVGRADPRRTDAFVRAYVGQTDGMGLRFDALLGSSSYRDTSATRKLDRDLNQGAAAASYRAARWSAELSARARDSRTPLDLMARGAWSPLGLLALSGYARRATHLSGRRSIEAGLAGEFRPWRALTVHGATRWRDAVPEPQILTDTAQKVRDWSFGAGLRASALDLDVTMARHDRFEAPAYGVFARQVPAATAIDVRTLTVAFSLRPTAYLNVGGWYRQPLDPLKAAYEPPTHSRVFFTFRSRFLPTFRRGLFDLLAQVGLEGWGSGGVAGRDSTGATIGLKAATYTDWLLEIRLVGAVLFWTMRNSQFEHYAVVPGFTVPRGLQRYGVRWEFTN